MPIFLTATDVFNILEREQPEGVYPHGAPQNYVSTAENFAIGAAVSGVYTAMQSVYQNIFPQSATADEISAWEVRTFGANLPASYTLQQRINRVLGQIRSNVSMSLWDLLLIVNSYVPDGVYTQIQELGKTTGKNVEQWSIGSSPLGSDTYLGVGNGGYFGPNADVLANADWMLGGTTRDSVNAIRNQAYGFQIRIFNYSITNIQLADLTSSISSLDKAVSNYAIFQNLDPAFYKLTTHVTGISQFDNINCIARNPNSPTGYDGLIRGT